VYPADQERRAAGAGVVRLISAFPYAHQIGTVCIDAVLVVLAYYTAYLLRFEGRLDAEVPAFVQSLPVVLVCQLAAFALFRVYQGMWRYTSVGDFIRLAQAASVGTIAAVVALLFLTRFAGYSRAVFAIDWLLLVTSVGAARLSFRALSETFRRRAPDGGRRVLIYGAGDGGVMVVRELVNNHALGREAVAFLDDDRSKHRTRIQSLPVIGGLDALARAVRTTGATEVIVSSAKVPESSVQELATAAGELGVTVVRASLKLE